MNFKELLRFLGELQQNNSKEWMDANRKRYQQLRKEFIAWLDDIDRSLAEIDDGYYPTPGKKGINRINNNLMFHPNKPIYKDHFAAGLDKAPGTGDFYVEIGLQGSLFAGGIWRPEPKTLRSIREAIDYDGEEFQKILNKRSFKALFGDLYEDEKLTTAPKGFQKDHPYIDLLRNKSFGVVHRFSNEEVFQPDFKDKLIKVYLEMLPFRRYLNKAITV
ncbi:DUF2461 domain-containing protein [Poritiphilus flavus]|uniref:TIGR02453 family protein n=1 Tax=Poritiphilus flavus TaxID=2697053 RepID=A0A6L9EA13_9FLAO|nr:DUF2461 domain-containing protein [Poritiphilus flavus]NAS11566.1 TIGR02453 family protein [Poritiphilus flavus]